MKKTNLNIALFTPNQNPYSETFIQAHKKYLKGNIFYYYGKENHIKLENKGDLVPYFFKIILKIYARLTNKSSKYVLNKSVLKSIKNNKIDVILVEYGTHAYYLKQVLKDCGLPIIVHFHGYDASVTNIVKNCNNYKEIFQLATKIIAVSKKMEDMLLKLGCPSAKLLYNVYGPQPEFETVEPEFKKKQFIAIGRFTEKKAPYYTILAFKEVLKTHSDALLLMAGNGELLNVCKNLVKYYKLEKSIIFLGVITPEDYRSHIKKSLAFVQHSITAASGNMEGTPLTILEASVAGLPVISTKHAGIPDVIIDKETGLLSEEHDVEAMTENMLQLLNDLNLSKRLGKRGKENIKANYNIKRHIGVLDQEIENAVHHF
ncbi:glycosyltransferase [Flavobacteriaceae bacterium AU392]|nr:glycosyltransferase [Flavobacteriaceae bacterium]RKM82814.1 glycosyltransferase [Flavobacteriaceae bacterium AU392]